MSNFNELELPLTHLIYDIAIDIFKNKEIHKPNDGDIYDTICDYLNIEFTWDELIEIKAYIKAKKYIYQRYSKQFKDKSDIILLETKRIRNRGFELNKTPF